MKIKNNKWGIGIASAILSAGLIALSTSAATLNVGPSETHTTISAAITAAAHNDVIAISPRHLQ